MKKIIDFFLWIQQNPGSFFKDYKPGNKECYLIYNTLYTNFYIGIGNPGRNKTHKNDLVSLTYDSCYWKTIIISNIQEEDAMALEAAIIKYGENIWGLSQKEDNNISLGKLLNKQRELHQEELIPKRIINGNNFASFITG